MWLSPAFTYTSATPAITCAVTTPTDASASCSFTSATNLITFTTGGATYSTSSDNTFTIRVTGGGIVNPPTPGEYPIEVFVKQGGIDFRHQTYLYTVVADDLAGLTVTPLSLDTKHHTLYKFKFTIPANLSTGVPSTDPTNTQTLIKIELETNDGTNNQFNNTIYTGSIATQSLPCYGIKNIYRRMNCAFWP